MTDAGEHADRAVAKRLQWLIENRALDVFCRHDSFAQTVLRSWRIKNSRFVAIRNSRAITGGPQSGQASNLEIFIYGNSSFSFGHGKAATTGLGFTPAVQISVLAGIDVPLFRATTDPS